MSNYAAALMGIAEIAEYFGVRRQRAQQIQKMPTFPAPLARLRCGPIYSAEDVHRFGQSWERRNGRPPKRGHDATS